LIERTPFRRAALPLSTLFLVTACTSLSFSSIPPARHDELVATVDVRGLREAALSWHIPHSLGTARGARLLADAPRPARIEVAVARAIVRSNPLLEPLDALRLATVAARRAREAGLDPNFFCATLLQESAFDPFAVSSAGALGIAQFTLETADAFGIEPLDPQSALAGSARLLAAYVRRYRGTSAADPYVLALAAYNAGPLAVQRYAGVPPYAETRAYIGDIIDRLGRIVRDEITYP